MTRKRNLDILSLILSKTHCLSPDYKFDNWFWPTWHPPSETNISKWFSDCQPRKTTFFGQPPFGFRHPTRRTVSKERQASRPKRTFYKEAVLVSMVTV
jgi:hypothetical protein